MGYKARSSAGQEEPTNGASSVQEAAPPIPVLPLHETIRRAIQVAVTVHPSLRAAARALEMPPSSLRDKLDQFGIDMPGSRPNRSHPCQPAFTMRSGAASAGSGVVP